MRLGICSQMFCRCLFHLLLLQMSVCGETRRDSCGKQVISGLTALAAAPARWCADTR
jgi:hypothetical protein